MLLDLLGENDVELPVLYSEHLTGDGQTMFEHAARLNWEGIISKRADAPWCTTDVPVQIRGSSVTLCTDGPAVCWFGVRIIDPKRIFAISPIFLSGFSSF